MGSIWAGEHIEQGIAVAVKVINADPAPRSSYLKAFRNEVRAVAGLDHPGIVMIFDHGQVPPSAEDPSGGRMLPNSPYLVMELASGGSLDDLQSAMTWPQLEDVLFGLLDALGHAHARGVVHRDLKPGNVLVCTADDLRPGIKLADFGLSHAGEVHGSGSRYSGTPRYMAPEQFHGEWRDYGPWTDLYALGCVAFELVGGQTPFEASDYTTLRQGHLYADPPGLVPSPAFPAGFEAWLMRLLEKDPRHRFQSAADAAWALWTLDPPKDPEAHLKGPARGVQNRIARCTLALDSLYPPIGRATQHFYEDLPGQAESVPPISEVSSAPPMRMSTPSMPRDWRRPAMPRSMRLVGAGLSLYGLRRVPLVGREPERDAIWEALARVRATGHARAVVIRGPGGVGKSRLVEWMAQRSQELGSALLLKATHGPTASPRDGLPGMLTRRFRCAGLSRDDTLNRVERQLRSAEVDDPYEWHALTELMMPWSTGDSADRVVSFAQPSERYVLVRRLIKRMDRPCILWLDDAQSGSDAVHFAWDLLEGDPCPALLVLTVRDDTALTPLDALLQHPRCTLHDLPLLGAEDRRQLVQGLLMLEGEVATQVEERTGGNPLFAVQLVGDWVQRRILLPGPDGFVLEQGANLDIPDDLHHLWASRLSSILNDEHERVSLELAALLGASVDEQEWRVALEAAEQPYSEGLSERLVDRRLALEGANGNWRFRHPLMRESLERSAREQDRCTPLHSACADMLSTLYPIDQQGVPARLGTHLLAAELYEDSLEPLLLGAEQHLAASEYIAASELMEQRAHTVRELRLPESDPRVGEGWLLQARVLVRRGRYGEGAQLADQAARAARRHGWEHLVPKALYTAAQAASRQGWVERSMELTRNCVREARTRSDRSTEAQGLRLLAVISQRTGHTREALRLGRQALELFRGLDDERGMADALTVIAGSESSAGRLERATSIQRRAVKFFESCGSQYGLASAHNNLADFLRKEDDLVGAEAGFREALATHRRIGHPDAVVPLLNLGIVLTARGEHAPAREHLRAGLALATRAGNGMMRGFSHALSLPSTAVLKAWESWGDHLAGARGLTASGVFDPDVAAALQQAGIEAARSERWEHAREALELAETQWEGLGREWEIERVRKALETIG